MKKRQWKKKATLGLLSVGFFFIAGGFSYQAISSNLDKIAYPPPGTMIDMGGYQMHIQKMGQGAVTVILDAGMACFSLDWALVQPEIAKFARVLSYDRAGYGWSDVSPHPRTSQDIVGELHILLETAGMPPPYILVGHSFGGVNMRLYANSYPDEVIGIVLVDSAHEEHFQKMPIWPQRIFERWLIKPEVATFGATIGFVRLFNTFMDVKKVIGSLPKEVQDMYLANICTTKYVKTVAEEFYYFPQSLQQIKDAPKRIGNKPLSVISAGQSLISEERGYDQEYLDLINQIWHHFQMDLVGNSSKGKQIIADKSGHMISHQQPELIVSAVREMVNDFKP